MARQRSKSLAQVEREPMQKISWLWEGWIAKSTAVTAYGDGESMKSFILLALGISIATETPLFTGAPTSGGPVLFVSWGENPMSENERRAQALLRGRGIHGTDRLWLYDANAPLLTESGFDRLRKEIDKRHARVLIVDSLTSNAGLAPTQSNDADAVRALLARTVLTLAREHEVTVLGIAHTPKFQAGEPKPKGTVEWFNAVDSAISIRARMRQGQRQAVLKHGKGRIGGRDPRSLWIEFHDLNPGKTAIEVRSGYSVPDVETGKVPKRLARLVRFAAKCDNGIVTRKRALHYFKNDSDRTIERWFEEAAQSPFFEKTGRGVLQLKAA